MDEWFWSEFCTVEIKAKQNLQWRKAKQTDKDLNGWEDNTLQRCGMDEWFGRKNNQNSLSN